MIRKASAALGAGIVAAAVIAVYVVPKISSFAGMGDEKAIRLRLISAFGCGLAGAFFSLLAIGLGNEVIEAMIGKEDFLSFRFIDIGIGIGLALGWMSAKKQA